MAHEDWHDCDVCRGMLMLSRLQHADARAAATPGIFAGGQGDRARRNRRRTTSLAGRLADERAAPSAVRQRQSRHSASGRRALVTLAISGGRCYRAVTASADYEILPRTSAAAAAAGALLGLFFPR